MPEDPLHVGQRQGGVFGHAVGGGVAQRVQGDIGSDAIDDALEHAVNGVVAERAERAAAGPEQRLAAPGRDDVLHLELIEPQPHKGVGRSRQLLERSTAFSHHAEQLATRIDASLDCRQKLRSTGAGRDIEGDQRPVPVGTQAGEDRVERLIGHRPRDPLGDPRPINADAFIAELLHRVVMAVRTAASP